MTKGAKVIGLNELTKDLNHMVKELGYDNIAPILQKHGETVSTAMKGLVNEKTGQLKNSIGVLPPSKKYGIQVIVGPDFKKYHDGITTPALAAIIEYGAGIRVPNPKRKKAIIGVDGRRYVRVLIAGQWRTMAEDKPFQPIPARPFIRPAFDMTKEKVGEGIVKDMKSLIDKKAKENNLKTK